jgi:hypothetical protein
MRKFFKTLLQRDAGISPMVTVYNLKNERSEINRIQRQIKNGVSGYRTKWGMFGTSDWFENIKNNNLIESIDGEISEVFMAGHNDFPMFRIFDGYSTYEFERIGREKFYKKGKKIHLEGIRNENIRPSSGLEKWIVPIKIDIEK